MKQIFKYLLLSLALWFLVHTAVIVYDGLTDERQYSDAVVILGNKVNEDGTVSERLAKRLDKGVELYQDSLTNHVVVSGGLGKEGFYEGTKMAEYLIAKGIPKGKIIIDNEGVTTQATAKNFHELNINARSVTVVSQYYHISRTKLAFSKQGYETVYGIHADYFELRDIYSLIREFFGYYKYLLLG